MTSICASVIRKVHTDQVNLTSVRIPVRQQFTFPVEPIRECKPKVEFFASSAQMAQAEASFMLEYAVISDNPLIVAKLKELMMCVKLVIDEDVLGYNEMRKLGNKYHAEMQVVREKQLADEERYQVEYRDFLLERRRRDQQLLLYMDDVAESTWNDFNNGVDGIWENLFVKAVERFEATEAGISTQGLNVLKKFKLLNLEDKVRVFSLVNEDHEIWLETQFDKLVTEYKAGLLQSIPAVMKGNEFISLFNSQGNVKDHCEAMDQYADVILERNAEAADIAYDRALDELNDRRQIGMDGYDDLHGFTDSARYREFGDEDGNYF